MTLSRRRFLVDGLAVAGGFALGFPAGAAEGRETAPSPEVTAWVVIHPDDRVVIRIARSEMGQGTLTGLAQLVAEELECDWDKVGTEFPTPGANLARNKVWGSMFTAGSHGIRDSHLYVRQGGAAARMMLVEAAAWNWNVPAAECEVEKGVIRHGASGKTTTYGKVAAAAARLTPPDKDAIRLKDPKDWTIAGKPMNRLDTRGKVDGSLVYGIDLRLPGMMVATIASCPVKGGTLKSFDASAIAGSKGVRHVLAVDGVAVAVVADDF